MKKISKLLLVASLLLVFTGCAKDKEEAKPEAGTGAAIDVSAVKVGRGEYAAHGTKCFTVAVAAVQGDTIIAASLDDYQFLGTDVATGVPNSDAEFGENYKDAKLVLASKKANADYYSEHMKEAGGSKIPLEKSFAAIEDYVTGKTIAELESVLGKKDEKQMVDAVSGASLVDTKKYINALVDAAKKAE